MISDDDLILYYYRDGLDANERARIAMALSTSPELAQRLHRLVGRLDAAASTPEQPVPVQFQRRWQAALEKASQSQAARTGRTNRMLFNYAPWYAAAAGVFIAACTLFMLIGQPRQPQTANVPAPANKPANNSVYERGLASHLANTEQQLVSLQNATPEERKRLVETILEQNRVYALAAERAGEPQLARVLRAFTPILESVQQGGDTSASLDQLEFELRVMQGRLATGKASNSRSTTL